MVRIERLRGQSDSDYEVISRTITIFKLPDEYYLVFDWASGKIGKIRCDDIGGLKEYFDEVLENYPKVEGLGVDQKKELKMRLSNIDSWPMTRIKSLNDFLKSSES
jgi:hypothetical protein